MNFKTHEETPFRTELANGCWIEGEPGSYDTVSVLTKDEHGEPVVEQRRLAGQPTADGFPSAWHRERYISDNWRELAGVEHRLKTLTARPGDLVDEMYLPKARAELEGYRKAVLAELKRLGENVFRFESAKKRKR